MSFSNKQVRALSRNVPARAIRTRMSSGKELTFIEGWYAVAQANRIFGFDGWDRETVETKCVQAREVRGTFTAIYSAKVRVSVRTTDSVVVREGHGTGEAQGPSPGEVQDRALKAAETDATKRALATFGSAFGLALYAGDRRTRPTRPSRRPNGRAREEREGGNGASAPAPATAATVKSASVPTDPDTSAEAPRKDRDDAISALVPATPVTAEPEPVLTDPDTFAEAPKKDRAVTQPMPRPGRLAVSGRVDKNVLKFQEPHRVRDKDHLRYVACQPCLLCSATPSDAHHVRFAQPRAMARKVGDDFTVPLCRKHHRDLHDSGNESAWWHDIGIEPLEIAKQLWEESQKTQKTFAGLDLDGYKPKIKSVFDTPSPNGRER